ncbi:MAG: discoidin domain-containing protein [Verrucomicrobiota bacterium]|jgi:hypothetical protein
MKTCPFTPVALAFLTALALPCLPVAAGETLVAVDASMVSASSWYDGYTPITSFEGDQGENTGWCAAGGQQEAWLEVDFGTNLFLTRFRLVPDRYIATDPSYSYLDSFILDISQGGAWVAASDQISTPEEVWYEVTLNTNTTGLRILAYSSGNGPQIKEVEIYQWVGQPQLQIQSLPASAQVALSWPVIPVPYQLESCTNLGGVDQWQSVVQPVAQSGGWNFVTNSALGAASFFRLRQL